MREGRAEREMCLSHLGLAGSGDLFRWRGAGKECGVVICSPQTPTGNIEDRDFDALGRPAETRQILDVVSFSWAMFQLKDERSRKSQDLSPFMFVLCLSSCSLWPHPQWWKSSLWLTHSVRFFMRGIRITTRLKGSFTVRRMETLV